MKFEYAPQGRVGRYETEVGRILAALGYDAADCAVSDESLLTDFADFGAAFSDAELQRLSTELGVAVTNDSFIADVAESLHAKLAKG